MRKKDLLISAAFGAAVISFAGTALATGVQPAQPGQLAQATTPGTDAPAAQPGAADVKEGMEVVNAEGRKIGEVTRVDGDQVIVSIGEYLGMGERQVVLQRDQLKTAGAGEQPRLEISMSDEELRQLPAHEAGGSGATGGTGGTDAPAAQPGGNIPERDGGAPSPTNGGGG